jgi:hypothetical protein
MPYGDLAKQVSQRFAVMEDMDVTHGEKDLEVAFLTGKQQFDSVGRLLGFHRPDPQ